MSSERTFTLVLALSLFLFVPAGCSSSGQVARIDADTVTDLSGNWNDADSGSVAEAAVKELSIRLRPPRRTPADGRLGSDSPPLLRRTTFVAAEQGSGLAPRFKPMIGSPVLNDNLLPYEGEDFEKVYVNLILALNYDPILLQADHSLRPYYLHFRKRSLCS